jgi:K+-sensing histidine kinase KdpD
LFFLLQVDHTLAPERNNNMNKIKLTPDLFARGLRGMLIVAAMTVPMWLTGRDVLGEAVIGLLYLAPIAWSASKWGQVSGVSAALTAALLFDFLFIPPFYTFVIGSLEGWLVLVIFFAVAILVVGRIQDSLSKAREATFMYELTSALANARTQDAVAHTLASYVRQLFQASHVNVTFQQSKRSPRIAVSEPQDGEPKGRPDRLLPILNAWGLAGEIQVWRGEFAELPAEDSRLLQNFVLQAARAFERTYSLEMEKTGNTSAAGAAAK